MLTLGKCLALALLGNWQAPRSFGREVKCLVVLFCFVSVEFLNLSGVSLAREVLPLKVMDESMGLGLGSRSEWSRNLQTCLTES